MIKVLLWDAYRHFVRKCELQTKSKGSREFWIHLNSKYFWVSAMCSVTGPCQNELTICHSNQNVEEYKKTYFVYNKRRFKVSVSGKFEGKWTALMI